MPQIVYIDMFLIPVWLITVLHNEEKTGNGPEWFHTYYIIM